MASLHAALLARWQPWDAAEAHQVQELLFAHWRQARLRAIEEAVLARLRRGEPLGGLPSLASVLRYRARIDRALAGTTAELRALQARRDRTADPARLRRLAEQIERGQARHADGTNEPTRRQDGNCTNEFLSDTNEPTSITPPGGDAECTNEIVAGTNEPSASLARPNRHQRRRLAALAKRKRDGSERRDKAKFAHGSTTCS